MAKKWIGAESRRQERAGTTGSLRAIAKSKGLLSGKDDTLTSSDLNALEAAAKRKKGEDGKMTKEGIALFRKVQFARNAMKSSKK